MRLFAIFLDDYHVRLENSMRAREVIAQFVENQLQPADMAGIMYPLWSISDVLLTPESQGAGQRHPRVHRPQVRLHAAESIRRTLRPLRVDDRGRADSQRCDADGDERR